MKQILSLILIVASLQGFSQGKNYDKAAQAAQQKTDSTTIVFKGNVQLFQDYVNQLEKLKALMVLFKSPYDEVMKVDNLIMAIYQQVTPQIKK